MPTLKARDFANLVKRAGVAWADHKAPRLGAALAFYSLLSIAPLLILMVAICGLVFEKRAAEAQLLGQVQEMAGPSGANALRVILSNTHHARTGLFASAVALITLLFGASGVFVELRDSLNTIWDAPPSKSGTWQAMVWQRIVSFGMVLALGFLLLTSLLLSTAIAVVGKFFAGRLSVHAAIWGELANFFIPLIAIAVLFALIFKFVPDVPIAWRDVGIGAVATALLFQIGKALLALYFATAAVGSTYGAAGSLVAFVVWVYYSAQIFFFGAVFTKEYAKSAGSLSLPNRPSVEQEIPSRKAASRSASA